MSKILQGCLILLLLSQPCISQSCKRTFIDGEAAAINVLNTLNPSQTDPDSIQCIVAAINMCSYYKSPEAIPQLIRYLPFHEDRPPEESKGLMLHPLIEGDDYPATLALSRIGQPARPALLAVIKSKKSSALERQNAAHAIILSFLHEPEHDPGKGILYLRHAEVVADSDSKEFLEQSIKYAATTTACTRFQPKCDEAMYKSLNQ